MGDNKKVAVMITDLFEDAEYSKPAKALKDAGHELIHIGIKKGATVKGKRNKQEVRIDKAISNVSIDDFDALLIPGGYSPDKLRIHGEAVNFVKNFVKKEKPVFFICHGGQLLISADVLKGRKVTGWKSIKQDLINAGAEYIDKEVVEDDNLISSRQPQDISSFNKAIVKKLD
jgi:protease I